MQLKGNKPFPINHLNRIDIGCFTVHGLPGTYGLGFQLKTPVGIHTLPALASTSCLFVPGLE